MQISLAVGFLMLTGKLLAYFITGSAAILSDAAESVVHVIAVSFAAYSLRLSYRPIDSTHPYGYDRVVYFSAGFEGAMIIMAALYIVLVTVRNRFEEPARNHPFAYEELLADGGSTPSGKESKKAKKEKAERSLETEVKVETR